MAKEKKKTNHQSNRKGKQFRNPDVKFLIQVPLRSNNTSNEQQTNGSTWCFTGGYVGLFGPLLDNMPTLLDPTYDVQLEQQIIPQEYRDNKRKRDGDRNHMTLMLKQELLQVCADGSFKDIFASTLERIRLDYGDKLPANFDSDSKVQFMHVLSYQVTSDDFAVLGIGKVRRKATSAGPQQRSAATTADQSNNSKEKSQEDQEVQEEFEETFYRIVQWDSANDFLEMLGLPRKDLHVTLGFKNKDIHGVRKNIATKITQTSTNNEQQTTN